ncbi:MAG TPA: Ig-like domain-containing protein [Archangium sp.]|uniref:Ig-like domain-containing protein n=1 Tax=Archangium sp. TaxID=1872627 RepID=UPI002EDB051D
MNSKASRRALPGVARIASVCTLLLSLACSDKPGLSGARPDVAPTSEQSLAQTDLTATSTFDGGVYSYVATLPPAAVVGTISQTVEAQWDPNVHGIRQAPTYPQDWSLDYYAGGTKLAQAPVTASEWARVSRIVTTGSLMVEAVDGDRQALISTVNAPVAVVAPSFSGGSAGDGWDVIFDPAYTRVFNIHHHNGPATLMCRKLADSTACPGFPMALTQTSHRSTGRIDAASNKLWHPTTTTGSSPRLAWDCVDLATSARCTTPVVLSEHAASTAVSWGTYNDHVDPVVIGRKLYAIGFASGGVTRITCLDMATGTECPGLALPENGSVEHSSLKAVANKLHVLPGANLKLDCYDSTTWERCPGSWPQPVNRSPVWAPRSADGAIRNICADTRCFGLDGSAHTLPPNFITHLTGNPVVGLNTTFFQMGSANSAGTKAVWSINGNKTTCWDMATDAKCADAFPIAVNSLYTSNLDPEDPDCLWTNGDDGVIRNWKISTGAQGCGGGPARISFKASVAVPRLSCDPEDRVYQYKSFKLIAPNPTQYTSARLTVRDSNGVPVAGWTDLPLSAADPSVNLTALSPSVVGSTPTFDIAAEGFTDTSVVPVGEFRVTTGSPPQLCWDLAVPALTCPTGPGLASTAPPSQVSTAVTAKGSFTTGSGVNAFTDQVLNSTVTPNTPTFDNCGGTRLRATVVSLVDGGPVAGATVFLLDSAGTPILDANGQPVSAVSAADGTVEFPVWAAGYTLKLSGTARYRPVYMNVTAGGSGATFASGGSVVSNTVTTTVNQTSHVNITVTVDEEPTCAPVVTSPAGGTVVYEERTPLTGTADPGSTVTVRVNGQPVCTVVANAQGIWNCTAELPVGPSTVTATATDEAGNTSGSSSAVLLTRRDGIDPPVITGPAPTVQGKGVTVTGTAHPGADVTVKDEQDNTVCTAKADAQGAWACDTTLSAGPHQLTADASWEGFQSTSNPHDTTVLDEAWFQGSGCTSTGGAQPALMLVLALSGLAVLRRRRA